MSTATRKAHTAPYLQNIEETSDSPGANTAVRSRPAAVVPLSSDIDSKVSVDNSHVLNKRQV